MIVFQQVVLVLSLLTTAVFGVDCLVIDNPKVAPRTKARMGVLLGVLFLAYLVLLTLFAVLGAVLNRNALYLALAFYVAAPFVIGRLASYRTLRFYTVVQIAALLASAVTLHFI